MIFRNNSERRQKGPKVEKVSLAKVNNLEQRRDYTKTSGKLDYDFQGCSEDIQNYIQWLPAPGCDRVPPLTSRVASTQSLKNSRSTKKPLGQKSRSTYNVFDRESLV